MRRGKVWDDVSVSFERFCLTAGIDALSAMMDKEADELCRPGHARAKGRRGCRWGRAPGKVGFPGGKIDVERPRVRELGGPGSSGRGLARVVGDESDAHQCLDMEIPSGGAASGGPYSRTSGSPDVEVRRISAFRSVVKRVHEELIEADPSGLDLLVVQIDGIQLTEHASHF
jgi:putative transposase